MLRRLRAIANSPWTPAILVLYFALDLWCIGSRYGWSATHASRLLYEPLFGRPKWNPQSLTALITTQDDGTPIVVFQDDADWDNRPELHHHTRAIDYISVFLGPRRDCGIYAPTYTRADLTVHPAQFKSLTSAQQSTIRRQFVDHWVARRVLPTDLSDKEIGRFVAGQPVIRTTHLPLGYLHNTLSLAMFLMLLWSLRLNIPKLFRRRDPTRCPHCGYSTVGLPTTTCPECGGSITISP